ncbi:uncharacterized protein CIMG_07572 [Coccidioides immitis RS]|uniref:Zn(2)-C6 fungal-type domain-containing protein n=3 Tax=Coccidioides immitis TaxID=5501 RepID=J3K3P1_COCIM|nr:uncharacterized protein CIMG_07572 [Coccidioides immitis RS]EAS28826.3 hypothetical protein CIMG_07572 [Coccidioides immitis RS]KMP05939.1 hypothetical protein CIRG_05620 [Coccidioides immitis RMSCC 2394]KMU76628.1 hypothetical protein CISG_05771 [Coccidioides immitis RMSCC 3703]
MMGSVARLRTRTGCLECRRRRKKCDEKRPLCAGCSRNGLRCTWPSEYQPVDRRRRCPSPASPSASSPSPSCNGTSTQSRTPDISASLPPFSAMPPPFRLEEHFNLYCYFANSLLPTLVRQCSLPKYSDQTYILNLAVQFPPLMGAMIAVAAVRLPRHDESYLHLGLKCYHFSIQNLREGLASDKYKGNEDYLLATTILLCIWENCQPDGIPNTSHHVVAAGNLLRLRCPKPRSSSQSALVFERTCVESFIYHSSLLMLFDRSLDPLADPQVLENIQRYFVDPDHPDDAGPGWTNTQPILDASYKFFLLTADITRLSRHNRPLDEVELSLYYRLQSDFHRWEQTIRKTANDQDKDRTGLLYTLAIRALLLKMDPHLHEISGGFESLLHESLEIIPFLNIDPNFVYYYLWPLIVLGSIAVNPWDRNPFREIISLLIIKGREGIACWALKRLETVWTTEYEYAYWGPSHPMLRGLKRLLEND